MLCFFIQHISFKKNNLRKWITLALSFQASLSKSVCPTGTSLLCPAVLVRYLWTSQSALCPSGTSLFGLCVASGRKKGTPVRTAGLCPAQHRCNVTVPTANLPVWIGAELEDRLEVSCINEVTCLLTHSHTHYGIVCVSTGALCSITVLWSLFHSGCLTTGSNNRVVFLLSTQEPTDNIFGARQRS